MAISVDTTCETTPSVAFFVDSSRASYLTEPPYRFVFDTHRLSDGNHVFQTVASDPGGRTKGVWLRTTVDNSPPRVGVLSSSPVLLSPDGDGQSDLAPVLLLSSEKATAQVVVRPVSYGPAFSPPTASFWLRAGRRTWWWDGRSADGTSMPEGSYRVSFSPVDPAGNRGQTANVLVSINKTLSQVRASASIVRSGRPVTLSYLLRRRAAVSWWMIGPGRHVVARSPRQYVQFSGRHRVLCGRAPSAGIYRIVLRAKNWLGSATTVTKIRII